MCRKCASSSAPSDRLSEKLAGSASQTTGFSPSQARTPLSDVRIEHRTFRTAAPPARRTPGAPDLALRVAPRAREHLVTTRASARTQLSQLLHIQNEIRPPDRDPRPGPRSAGRRASRRSCACPRACRTSATFFGVRHGAGGVRAAPPSSTGSEPDTSASSFSLPAAVAAGTLNFVLELVLPLLPDLTRNTTAVFCSAARSAARYRLQRRLAFQGVWDRPGSWRARQGRRAARARRERWRSGHRRA